MMSLIQYRSISLLMRSNLKMTIGRRVKKLKFVILLETVFEIFFMTYFLSKLFVFARNSFIEKDYLSKSSFVLSLVQVRFDPGNFFDDGDIFGSKAEKNKV